MARHVIQIPINKSSNGISIYHNGTPGAIGWVTPPAVSNTLYMSRMAYNSQWTVNSIGLGWDSDLIPKNKTIISIKLNIYAKYSFKKTIVCGDYGFTEGSHIGAVSPSIGAFSGAFTSGWNVLDISNVKGNSVVIGSNTQDNTSWGEFNSHRNSTNKPYLEVTYDDIPPEKPSSLYPDNITLNPRDIIKFSWLHNSKEELEQESFNLKYSTNSGSTWTTVMQTTPNQFYEMPASTLPTSGTVMWKVMTADTNGGSEEVTASFTLGIVPQKAPIPIAPISQYIEENNPVRFEWSFVGGSDGETQSKFDLQYSANGGSTWTTKTATSIDQYYELPSNTFTGGNITWRVRTYNNWNEVSPYSENRSFTVIGSPPIPLINNVSNSGKPLISWQSTNQHLYELEILKDEETIYSTGSIPSTSNKSFKLPIYLKDGNYKVKLRIANEYNLYSPWAEKSFIISTVKPNKPTVNIISEEHSVGMVTSNTSLKTYVYRDGVYIGEVSNNYFADYTGENNKEYKYFIRTIDENDNFIDSDLVTGKCKFKGNTLAIAGNPSKFIKIKTGFGNNIKKSNNLSVAGGLNYYDGRKYPVAEFAEFKSKEKTLSFFFETEEEIKELVKLIETNQTLLYRDNKGENIYGTIFNANYDENIFGYEVGITITKTDYKGVAYD